MKIHPILQIALLAAICLACACQNGYLKKVPDKSVLVPQTYADFTALMDNMTVFNTSPALQEIGSDDYRTGDAGFTALTSELQKNSYIWAADIYEGQPSPDWNIPYQQVFYANIVLDGLAALKPAVAEQDSWNTARGSALFHRAFAFYNLAQLFAAAYDPASAGTLPGIPLRLTADVNVKAGRGNLKQVYDQVIHDLTEADQLLPGQVAYKNRPSKTAAEALLARVMLSMGDYNQAATYATAALSRNHNLTDYNGLDTLAANPFPYIPAVDNPEVIFYDKLISYGFGSSTRTTVAPDLFSLYAEDDLRRPVFFAGSGPNTYFKGRYTGFRLQLFGGLAVDELFLIRAESLARQGKTGDALADLNTLLKSRWRTGTYQDFTVSSKDELLKKVLLERRKELVFRGIRWSDLRRLNKDPAFARTLSRAVAGKAYTLAPGDKRYLFPIPQQELLANDIEQNER